MVKDLTVGKPDRVLWKFCLPLFASVIFQQLYNLADSFVAGKFGGELALAAVGNSYEITLVLIAFAFGCNIGGSVIAARYFGAKDYRRVRTAVYTTLIASGILCLLLMAAGLTFCRSLLRLIRTPEDIFEDCALYLRIYLCGLPFVFLYNISEGIFAGLGDSRTPFLFLCCSSAANIAADIAFAYLSDNVVSGVAWATFLCQSIACVLSVFFLIRKIRALPDGGQSPLFSRKILGEIAAVAVPSTLQQSFVSIGNVIIQRIVNGFGSGVIAGYSAAVKLNGLVITSMTALATGISGFTSQNLGGKREERVRAGFTAGLKMAWVLCVPFALIYFFAGRYASALFIDQPTDAALDAARNFLRIVAPFYPIIAIKLVADGVLRGARMMTLFMIDTFTDLIMRVILAAILSATALAATGIWLSWPIGWLIGAALAFWFYRTGCWFPKKNRRAADRSEENP